MPLQAPSNFGTPDQYGAEQISIERQRRLSEALQQQSQQPLDTNQQVGGWAIPVSPYAGLAKMLQGYSSRKGLDLADERQRALAEKYESDTTAAVTDSLNKLYGTPGTPGSTQDTSQQGTGSMDMSGSAGPGNTPAVPAQAADPRAALIAALHNPTATSLVAPLATQGMQNQGFFGAMGASGASGASPQGVAPGGVPTPQGQPGSAPAPAPTGPQGTMGPLGIPMAAYRSMPNGAQMYMANMAKEREGMFGKVQAKDYTPASLQAFAASGDRSALVPIHKMELANLGGTSQAFDPYEIKPGQNFTHTQGPDSIASNQVAIRGQNLTNQRALETRNIETVKADPFGILGLNKNAPAAANAGAGLTGDEYLKTLSPGIASQVKALAEGKLAITPRTLQSPQGSALLQMAMQYEPGTDQSVYVARAATRKDAATGKLAVSNNALNTVAGHLSQLSDSADSLNNTSFPWANKVKNAIATATGQPQVNAFNLNLMGVADELERAYRGAGGAAGEIKSWRDTLGDASSPQQFKAALQKGAEMLQSKIEANQAQIDQGMRSNTHGIQALTPKAEASFAKLRGEKPDTTSAPDPQAIADEMRRRGMIK